MCTNPRFASHNPNGGRINFSKKNYNNEMVAFQVPCGKCIECRLEYARTWAVRAMHEATMHRSNIFLTLTFNDDTIGENKLNYSEFQLFMKKLRNHYGHQKLSYIVAGEYGDKTGRKHYHAIIFGIHPTDGVMLRKDKNEHIIYKSPEIEKLWSHGLTEYGSVTFESCSYVARYCLKKRGVKESDPIFKTSRHSAIGKTWLEKNWKDIFNTGICITRDGFHVKIPRYYEKWLLKNHPEKYIRYISETKQKQKLNTERKQLNQSLQYRKNLDRRIYKEKNFDLPYNKNQQRNYVQTIKQSLIKRKLD